MSETLFTGNRGPGIYSTFCELYLPFYRCGELVAQLTQLAQDRPELFTATQQSELLKLQREVQARKETSQKHMGTAEAGEMTAETESREGDEVDEGEWSEQEEKDARAALLSVGFETYQQVDADADVMWLGRYWHTISDGYDDRLEAVFGQLAPLFDDGIVVFFLETARGKPSDALIRWDIISGELTVRTLMSVETTSFTRSRRLLDA